MAWELKKVEDQRKQPPPSFEQTQPRIRSQLQEAKVRDALEALRKSAKIERTE